VNLFATPAYTIASDIHLRISQQKIGNDVRQRELHGRHGGGASDGAGRLCQSLTSRYFGELGLAKHGRRMSVEVLPCVRQSETARCSVEQPDAQAVLEFLDAVAERRFGNAQGAARRGKPAAIDDLHKEVCAAFPAMTAVARGLDAYVAVDASGTFSETKREAGLLRMAQAGVILSDYATMMVEILKDNGRPEAGAVYGALDMPWATLVGQIAKAFGK